MPGSRFLTDDTLGTVLTQPFCLSQTNLLRESTIVVGSLMLPEGWRAAVGLLGLHFIRLSNLNVPNKTSNGLGMVFAGVYRGIEGVNLHTGRPLVYVSADVPGYRDSNPFGHHVLAVPGHYTILAVNNTDNTDIQVAVNGAFRLYRP